MSRGEDGTGPGENHPTDLGLGLGSREKSPEGIDDHDLEEVGLDLLDRDFTAPAPNTRWVADFTCCRTRAGSVYLAFVVDVYAQRIVGWHAATTKVTDLVLTPLRIWRVGQRSSPGELAGDLELSSGAMTSRLDRLEDAGYVRRLPDPDDRRGIVVELTPAGAKAWPGAAPLTERTSVSRPLVRPDRLALGSFTQTHVPAGASTSSPATVNVVCPSTT